MVSVIVVFAGIVLVIVETEKEVTVVPGPGTGTVTVVVFVIGVGYVLVHLIGVVQGTSVGVTLVESKVVLWVLVYHDVVAGAPLGAMTCANASVVLATR